MGEREDAFILLLAIVAVLHLSISSLIIGGNTRHLLVVGEGDDTRHLLSVKWLDAIERSHGSFQVVAVIIILDITVALRSRQSKVSGLQAQEKKREARRRTSQERK